MIVATLFFKQNTVHLRETLFLSSFLFCSALLFVPIIMQPLSCWYAVQSSMLFLTIHMLGTYPSLTLKPSEIKFHSLDIWEGRNKKLNSSITQQCSIILAGLGLGYFSWQKIGSNILNTYYTDILFTFNSLLNNH